MSLGSKRTVTGHTLLRNGRVVFWLAVGIAAFIYFAGPYILGTKHVHVAYLEGEVLFSSRDVRDTYGSAAVSIVKFADGKESNVRGRAMTLDSDTSKACVEKRRYVGSERCSYIFAPQKKCGM